MENKLMSKETKNSILSTLKEKVNSKKEKFLNSNENIKKIIISNNENSNKNRNSMDKEYKTDFINSTNTKMENTFVKKNILCPIKDLQTIKLKSMRETSDDLKHMKKKYNPNNNSEINKNISQNILTKNSNLYGSIDKTTYHFIDSNKVSEENTSIIEENLKTRENENFLMTQYDEKKDTKNAFKKNNIKIVCNYSNNSIKGDDFSNKNDNKKKLQKNNLRKSNNAIEINSNFDNNINYNQESNSDLSTKYISFNQSATINNINLSSSNISNFKSTFKKINISNKKKNSIDNTNNNLIYKTSNDKNISFNENNSFDRNSSNSILDKDIYKGKALIMKIENKVLNQKEEKYPLIPSLNKNMKFKNSNPLKTILFNCNDNLNITNKLFDVIGSQKNKKIKSITIEKLKKEEKELNIERDLKVDMSFKEKVFVYDGGYYISADFGPMQKFNLISKISENMAMNNRNLLIKQFEYDFKKDEDYIYKNELREEYLKNREIEKEREKIEVSDKHQKVEDYLENNLKQSDILIKRIDKDLMNSNKDRRKHEKENNKDNKSKKLKIQK